MNPVEPMLASGCMEIGPGAAVVILSLLAAWWLSGALAVVNLMSIASLRVPARLKKAHFGGWVSYVVPGIILLLGLYGRIPLYKTPRVIWLVYALVIPFVTVFHFIYLLRTHRKFGVGSGLPVDHGGR